MISFAKAVGLHEAQHDLNYIDRSKGSTSVGRWSIHVHSQMQNASTPNKHAHDSGHENKHQLL